MSQHLLACPHCDLLMRETPLPERSALCCPRCGCTLRKNKPDSLHRTLALCVTGILMYFPAIFLPLLTMEKLGMKEAGDVIQTIIGLYQSKYFFVAISVLLSSVAFPAALFLLLFTVCVQLLTNTVNRFTQDLFRIFLHLEEWAMVEVYLFGILVTIFKMSGNVEIFYNSGFFCFTALVFITLGLNAVCDHHTFWHLIAEKSQQNNQPPEYPENWPAGTTAAEAGLSLCLTCHHLQPTGNSHCQRCGSRLYLRKPNSISSTWALVLTSSLLLLPANILPIMEVDFLGVPSSSTIMDGILYFFEEESYGIGLIIFTASVLVPLFKILGLIILLHTVHFRQKILLRQKTQMFRCIAFIGRWSMLDIFVIAILNMLVQFGILSSIHAAPAATYFCIVVAATMLAAISFDPRIMWDSRSPKFFPQPLHSQ